MRWCRAIPCLVGYRHARVLAREQERGRAADAAPAAGDQRGLAIQHASH
jgi:hypothetical protein